CRQGYIEAKRIFLRADECDWPSLAARGLKPFWLQCVCRYGMVLSCALVSRSANLGELLAFRQPIFECSNQCHPCQLQCVLPCPIPLSVCFPNAEACQPY